MMVAYLSMAWNETRTVQHQLIIFKGQETLKFWDFIFALFLTSRFQFVFVSQDMMFSKGPLKENLFTCLPYLQSLLYQLMVIVSVMVWYVTPYLGFCNKLVFHADVRHHKLACSLLHLCSQPPVAFTSQELDQKYKGLIRNKHDALSATFKLKSKMKQNLVAFVSLAI